MRTLLPARISWRSSWGTPTRASFTTLRLSGQSPPSARFTSCGVRSWNFLGSQVVQIWGGSRVCESASIIRSSRIGDCFRGSSI